MVRNIGEPLAMNAKELREQRANIAAEIRKQADASNNSEKGWTKEAEEKWKAVNADYDKLSRQIEVAERAEKVAAEQVERREERDERRQRIGREDFDSREAEKRADAEQRAIPTAEERAVAMQAWALTQSGEEVDERQAAIAKKCGIRINSQWLDVPLRSDYSQARREYRDMNTSDESGLIPTGFVPNFERALLKVSGVRNIADTLRTPTGNAMTWPYTNDTSNKGSLVTEAASVTGGTDVSVSSLTLNAYKYTSKIILVSAELLRDSAINLVNVLGEICGERIGRALNDAYTTGTGSSQPNGIVTASTLGVTCASATAISMNEIMELIYGVNDAYRQSAGFMCNDAVTLAIRKLTDDNGQYLWQPSTQMGQPDRLLGYPVHPNSSMASTIQASAKVLLFGDYSYYKIRDVAGLRMRRLVERYADTDQDGFVAFMSTDADLLDAGTHPVKHMIMHA